MKHLKSFKNNKFKYKVGDFVKCIIDGENNGNPIFGKITDEELDIYDENTIFFTILTENGEITSVWQTSTKGEIKDYWDMNDEQFNILIEQFNILISANKYNL
jgi:chloramphenicol O-acetyltransferase